MPFSSSKLLRKSLLKGLFGGHRGWRIALAVLVIGRLLMKALKKGPGTVVHREKIPEGEALEIRHSKAAEEKLPENE